MKNSFFKYSLPFVFSVFLLGCAIPSAEKYDAILKTFVGKPESFVIERFGAPSKTYKSGGNNYLTYSKSSYRLIDTDLGITFNCDTTFVINSDIVQKYSFTGNGCTSK
jgi:hypothetical protein